jgi:hypothetical protein
VTFRRDDQNAEKPTFYDGIQLIQSHLYATTGSIEAIEGKYQMKRQDLFKRKYL